MGNYCFWCLYGFFVMCLMFDVLGCWWWLLILNCFDVILCFSVYFVGMRWREMFGIEWWFLFVENLVWCLRFWFLCWMCIFFGLDIWCVMLWLRFIMWLRKCEYFLCLWICVCKWKWCFKSCGIWMWIICW